MALSLLICSPYILLCCLFFFINIRLFKSTINTLNIYLIIWSAMLVLYQLKLINYFELSVRTWIVLYTTTILVSISYTFGRSVYIEDSSSSIKPEFEEKELKKIILIFSLISLIAIIPNTINLINRYGLNLLSATSEIYYDNLSGIAPNTIPYLGYFSQAACVLSGICFAKYSYNKILPIPIILSVINTLPSGSRGNIILTIFLTMLPFIILKAKKTKISKKSKKRAILLIIALIIFFVMLTINRSQNIDTQTIQTLSGKRAEFALSYPAIYKMYQYYTSPLGVLNAYLNNPKFSFGSNTFLPLFGLLNRLGFNIKYNRYQEFYLIPIRANVGTWIRELSIDFTVPGMYIVICIFSFIVGMNDKIAHVKRTVNNVYLTSILDTILIMSFFVWYFREGSMIILLIIYFLIPGRYKFTLGNRNFLTC